MSENHPGVAAYQRIIGVFPGRDGWDVCTDKNMKTLSLWLKRILGVLLLIVVVWHRQIVILITTLMVGFGVYGLYMMPKQEFPSFTVRQGLVVAVYPGATSDEIEEQVTKPLENFIFSYKEVKKRKTYSRSRDGIVFINVELNDNVKNKDEFWSKFKHGVEQFKSLGCTLLKVSSNITKMSNGVTNENNIKT